MNLLKKQKEILKNVKGNSKAKLKGYKIISKEEREYRCSISAQEDSEKCGKGKFIG